MFISRRSILQAGLILSATATLPFGLSAEPGTPITGFTHCVASGDPGPFSVRLWTRYVSQSVSAELHVEVSDTEDFRNVLVRTRTTASPGTDFCAQSLVEGLSPGRWYYYRFEAPDGARSPVGRTKTLPVGQVDQYTIGVVSCANATSGWFNAYAHAALRDDLDLIVHLGDYIYESPLDRSDALEELAVSRAIEPKGEAVSLVDYRLRYASYRRDPALMELHRRFPMIVIWDDHETANNSWQNGAKNHDPKTEGSWDIRKAAGIRAFQEWLPMGQQPYAEYRIGNLASLFRLETRLLARSEQLDISKAIGGRRDIETAVREFMTGPLAAPDRTMMGLKQESWLSRSLIDSVGDGTRWQVLLQQVIMAQTILPAVTPQWFKPGYVPTPQDQRERAVVGKLSALGVPFGLDRWDGYPAARNRLLGASKAAKANLVVLSADSHNAWAYDLKHQGEPAGIELAVQSVSSLGLDKRFDGDPAVISRDFVETNPGLIWCDTSQRGYLTVNFGGDEVTGNWHFVPSRETQGPKLLNVVSKSTAWRSNRFA